VEKITRRRIIQAGLIGGGASLLSGCSVVEATTNAAMGNGIISKGIGGSIIKSSQAVSKTFEDFTPEQEYYIGRTVSANIFQTYPAYINQAKLNYLNLVGLSLAQSSDKPETFGGYHFAILNSAEINAFAAPGGFVFVTLGMLKCCPNEDSLAAVLAHEIAHIQLKHGLHSISDSRVSEAITIIASETVNTIAGENYKELVSNFEGSVDDITKSMINDGYSRSYEKEADEVAMKILGQAGYSSKGMGDMLTLMDKKLKPGAKDFSKTHPSPKERLGLLSDELKNPSTVPASREKRLSKHFGLV
jgi:predicted Zn-dependent protease